MTRTPTPNDRFYRLLVRAGIFLPWTFQVRVIVTGGEHLPAPDPRNGASRLEQPGRGAVIAVTHFGYHDFADHPDAGLGRTPAPDQRPRILGPARLAGTRPRPRRPADDAGARHRCGGRNR